MNTLNERGMQRLQDWLRANFRYPPMNSVELNAWADKAEESCPPHIEIRASDSLSGCPVTLSFGEDEYWVEADDDEVDEYHRWDVMGEDTP